MDEQRLRKLAGLNEATELKEEQEMNSAVIRDVEKQANRRQKQLEKQLEKMLKQASRVGAEIATIQLGLDASLDSLADGDISSSKEAIQKMVDFAGEVSDENNEYFNDEFGTVFWGLVQDLVDTGTVKPKV